MSVCKRENQAGKKDPAVVSCVKNSSGNSVHAVPLSHPLLELQRKYGNRGVRRMITSISRQGHGQVEVQPDIEQAINAKRGGGQRMDSKIQGQMETAFNADFSGVRVHADAEADHLNRSLNARAFTVGRDVFFRSGSYNPGSSTGRELIAHELAHVVQQAGGISPKLTVGQADDEYEQEADRVARAVVRQEHVQRQPLEEEEEGIRMKENGRRIPANRPDRVFLLPNHRRWRWSSVEGRNRHVRNRVEVEDYTQRFLGLFMPKRAMLSYNASSSRYRSNTDAEVIASGHAVFTHFESFGRIIAKGWRTRTVRMSDARRFQLDPQSGTITLGVPTRGGSAGSTPERDGPLTVTARITNTQIQNVNDNHKKLAVSVKVHANIGGTITESVTGGTTLGVEGELGSEGASVTPGASLNLGGSWSISHSGGERYRLIEATPTFVFNAVRERT